MKRTLFEFIISPLHVFENTLYDWITLFIIGELSFHLAFYIAGKSDLKGELRSLEHWVIRIGIYVFLVILSRIIISICNFIKNNLLNFIIIAILILVYFILYLYSLNKNGSILNKKIF